MSAAAGDPPASPVRSVSSNPTQEGRVVTESEKGIFLRPASGLVRSISPRSAAIMSLMWTQVAAGFVLASLTAAYYPGANIPLTYWLIYPVSCSVGILYILFSAAMPRTGGDYIYVSRALHPLAGFVSNFMFNANIAGWIGTWVAFSVPAGLCAFFASWGIETGSAYYMNLAIWLINPVPYFLITALLNVLSGVIVYYGPKWTARFCWLFFVLAVIGIATMDIYMSTAGSAAFVAGWNQLSGTTYTAVIAAAQKAGILSGI